MTDEILAFSVMVAVTMQFVNLLLWQAILLFALGWGMGLIFLRVLHNKRESSR